jgi:hypothetical protein
MNRAFGPEFTSIGNRAGKKRTCRGCAKNIRSKLSVCSLFSSCGCGGPRCALAMEDVHPVLSRCGVLAKAEHCYGFAGPLLRVMLRVKTQKSPMFTRVVTLLRVQTPGRATPPLKPPFQMTNDKSSMEDSQFRRTDVVAASSALDCNPSESRGFARILVILTAQTSKIIHVYGGSLTG